MVLVFLEGLYIPFLNFPRSLKNSSEVLSVGLLDHGALAAMSCGGLLLVDPSKPIETDKSLWVDAKQVKFG